MSRQMKEELTNYVKDRATSFFKIYTRQWLCVHVGACAHGGEVVEGSKTA